MKDLKAKEQKDWYDQNACHYDDFWVNPISARVVDSWNIKNLKDILKGQEINRVLDLGCGTGKTTYELIHIGKRVTGYDISMSMLQRAKERCPNSLFAKGNSADIPFRSGIFDLVVTNGVWHHFADIESTINEVGRVLRKDGIFAVLGENNAVYKYDNPVHRIWRRYLGLPIRICNKLFANPNNKNIHVPSESGITNEPEGTEDINPHTFTSQCEKAMLRQLKLYTYDHIPRIENSKYIYRFALELEKIIGSMIAPYDGHIIQGFWIKE